MKKVYADRSLPYSPNAKFDVPEGFNPCDEVEDANDGFDEFEIDEVFE